MVAAYVVLAGCVFPRHRFAFDYSVQSEDLVFKFVADGYFSLHFTPGDDTIVAAHVTAGSTRRERIPNNCTEAFVIFSAEKQPERPQGAPGTVSLTSYSKSGTVEDTNFSPQSRIDLLLRFY